MARKQPKLSTVRSNISHLRKMLSRLDNINVMIPSKGFKPPKVVQSGSRLKIDGKVYTPQMLEELAKTKQEWLPYVTEALESKLEKVEYQYIKIQKSTHSKKTGKKYKITRLTEREEQLAMQGKELIDDLTVQAFTEWLHTDDQGSKDWKKHLFYHINNNDAITKGGVMFFMNKYQVPTNLNYKDTIDALNMADYFDYGG